MYRSEDILDNATLVLEAFSDFLLEDSLEQNKVNINTFILEHKSIINEDVMLYEEAKEGMMAKIKESAKKIMDWITEKIEPLVDALMVASKRVDKTINKVSSRLSAMNNNESVMVDMSLSDPTAGDVDESKWEKVSASRALSMLNSIKPHVTKASATLKTAKSELRKAKSEVSRASTPDEASNAKEDIKEAQKDIKKAKSILSKSRKFATRIRPAKNDDK